MDNRMTRRRKALYTQEQLANVLGCSTGTVKRLEKRFITKRQRSYLDAIGYEIGYYPRKREQE